MYSWCACDAAACGESIWLCRVVTAADAVPATVAVTTAADVDAAAAGDVATAAASSAAPDVDTAACGGCRTADVTDKGAVAATVAACLATASVTDICSTYDITGGFTAPAGSATDDDEWIAAGAAAATVTVHVITVLFI